MKRASTPPSAESAVHASERQLAGAAAREPDVALIHGVSADGGLQIIRRRGDRIEAGALHPVREGVPIHGELLALKPRESCPLLCDVEVCYAPERSAGAAAVAPAQPRARAEAAPAPGRRKGPAQVANDAYRSNWDSIWSRPKKRDAPN